jgi:hypothetical protein
MAPDGQVPVDMQAYENDYLFDLLGYRVLEQAIRQINSSASTTGSIANRHASPETGWATSRCIPIRARRHQLPEHR